ncbi:MAG: acetyl-CoA carboxylase, carboxyltransferase subunit beta [Planctomycetota bacterium]
MGWNRFRKKKEMPSGLWLKCDTCGAMIFKRDMEKKFKVCPECDHHFVLNSAERIELLIDEGTWEETHADLTATDRLHFVDKVPYTDRIEKTVEKTGMNEAMVIGSGELGGRKIILGILDFSYMGGSMGVIVGEKVTLAIEHAEREKLPLLLIISSGGARMQEGALSLMQMAKTCNALARFDTAGGLYISVLTHPTTGGVIASFAPMADVVIAEPGALIGFAGPRVIQTTLKQDLPPGFQRSEFLLEHGQVDRIVSRDQMKDEIGMLIDLMKGPLRPKPEVAAAGEG